MPDIEKNDHYEHLERIKTEDGSGNESLEQVQTHETIIPIDIENKQAFKGDDSDGKISWTFRNWMYVSQLGPQSRM